MKNLWVGVFAVFAWWSAAASAQNLVQNPGFEAGGASWTANGWSFGGPPTHTGAFAAGTGCVGAACITTNPGGGAWFYQDIPTTPGQTYRLTFWYATSNPADNPVELQVFFGTVPASLNAPGTCTGSCAFDTQAPTSGFVQVTTLVTATAATSRLEFLGRNDPAGIYVDDVSLVAIVQQIPTLSEWSLLLLALLLVGAAGFQFYRRRSGSA